MSESGAGKATLGSLDSVSNNFVMCLQDVLSGIGGSAAVREMFENFESSQFISDRICEIVAKAFRSEMNNQIRKLGVEHEVFEKFFGRKKLRRLFEMVRKNGDTRITTEMREVLFPHGSSVISQVLVLRTNLKQLKGKVEAMQGAFREDVEMAKVSVGSLVNASIANIHESQVNRTQYLERITEAHHKFCDIDIPKLRNKYEKEIAGHIDTEEALSRELRLTQKKLGRVIRQKQKLEDMNSSLRNKLIEYEGTSEELSYSRLRAQEFEGKNSALEKELRAKREQIDGFIDEMQEASFTETSIQNQLAALKVQVQEKDERIRQLRTELGKTQDKVRELTNSCSLDNASLLMIKRKIGRFEIVKRERDEAVKSLASLNSTVEDYENKNEQLEKANTELEKSLADLRAKLTSAMNELNERESMESELARMKEEKKAQQSEYDRKDKQVYDLMQKASAEEKKVKERTAQYKQERQEKLAALEELKAEKQAKSDFEKQTIQLQNELALAARKTEQMSKTLEDRDQEIMHLRKSASEATSTVHELELSMAKSKEAERTLQYQIAQLTESENFYKEDQKRKVAEIDELTRKISFMERESQNLRALSDEADGEMSKLRESSNELVRKNRNLTAQLEDHGRQIEQLNDKVRMATGEIAELQSENHELRAAKHQLQNDVDSGREEVKAALSQVQQVRAKLAETSNDLKIAQSSNESFRRENEKLAVDNQRMERDIEDLHEKMRVETGKLEQKITDMKVEKNALREQIEQANHEFKIAENRARENERELTSNLAMKAQEVQQLKQDLGDEKNKLSKVTQDLTDLQTLTAQIARRCGVDSSESIVGLVDSLRGKVQAHEDKIDAIKRAFHLDSDENIGQFCQEMQSKFEDLSKRESDMMEILGTTSKSELVDGLRSMKSRLGDLQREKEELEEIIPNIDAKSLRQIVDSQKDLAKKEAEIRDILKGTSDPGKIAEIKNDLDAVRKRIPAALDQGNIIESMDRLVSDYETLQQCQQLIPSDLKGSTPQQIKQLADTHREMEKVKALLPDKLKRGDVSDAVGHLVERNQLLEEIEKIIPSVKAQDVATMKQAMNDAISLFNEVYSVIAGAHVNVVFPVADDLRKKMLNVIKEFRETSTRNKECVDKVTARARKCGYFGNDFDEAFEYVLNTILEEEKQKALETMHKELSDVRAMSQKERTLFDNNKAKFKKKLAQVRAQMAEMQERMAKREEEVIEEVEEEKRKARASENELVREKTLREELFRLLDHKAVDMDLLKTRLNATELNIVGRFLKPS